MPHAVRVLDWAHVTGCDDERPPAACCLCGRSTFPRKTITVSSHTFPSWQDGPTSRTSSQRVSCSILCGTGSSSSLQTPASREGAAVQHVRSEHFTTRIIASDTEAPVLWSAPWRLGYDPVQPGSACGSAHQESWHHQSMAGTISRTHQTLLALYDDVKDFNQSRLNLMKKDVSCLHDWPCVGSHLDLHLLQGTALHAEGRSAARDLTDWDGWVSLPVEGNSTWFMFPRTLWSKAPKGSRSKFVPK